MQSLNEALLLPVLVGAPCRWKFRRQPKELMAEQEVRRWGGGVSSLSTLSPRDTLAGEAGGQPSLQSCLGLRGNSCAVGPTPAAWHRGSPSRG